MTVVGILHPGEMGAAFGAVLRHRHCGARRRVPDRSGGQQRARAPAFPLAPTQGDPKRLGQVIDNLVSNAIKYTPNGGGVAITMTHTGETATIAVSDTGMGIPKDEQDQMFGRFFRSSNARLSGVEGTGLGLAITRGIVEAHGGTIGFDSVEGVGSTFRVTLPRAHGGGLESAA